MGTLSYSSNNSGGSWWLSDSDWKAMEEAGWNVEWHKDEDRAFFRPDKNGRWLGALASRASIETDNPEATVSEWESLVGEDASAEGCNCCGNPHNFSYEDDNGKTRYFEIVTTSYGQWI